MFKNFFIGFIVGVVITAVILGGVSYYIFSKVNREHAETIKQRDIIDKQLRENIATANSIIEGLTITSQQIEIKSNDGVELIRGIKDCQSEIRKGLSSGSTQK